MGVRIIMRKLNFDTDTYLAIVETGRLIPLDWAKIRCLSGHTPEQISRHDLEEQVGEDLVFTSKSGLGIRHLNLIVETHFPRNADAYWDSCKKNVLTVRFYKSKT